MYRGYKTELNPNDKQITMFKKCAGCARFTYNWALELLIENYKKRKQDEENHILIRSFEGELDYTDKELKAYRKSVSMNYINLSAITLHKILNTKKDREFIWMRECSKWVMQNSLYDVENAYKRFFKGLSNYPQFKKKDKNDSFTLDEPIIVENGWIQLPKIGKVRLYEKGYLPIGRPKSATVSKHADRWFVSIYYEITEIESTWNNEVLGVDLGIKTLITCSDGTIAYNSTKLKELENSLKRIQRKMARQMKGSKSRDKTKLKYRKLHFRILNNRKDILHKTTSMLAKTKPHGIIVIEDLNVSGMMKNHTLAKSIANCGFYEFRRQLTYKCLLNGKKLIVTNRFFPSSKIDHKTGEYISNLKLSDRTIYHDDGTQTDRDLNAAINLKNYGLRELNKIP